MKFLYLAGGASMAGSSHEAEADPSHKRTKSAGCSPRLIFLDRFLAAAGLCLASGLGNRRSLGRNGLFRQGKGWAHRGWNLDLDFESRDHFAALHLHRDAILIDGEVLGDHGHDLFLKNGDEIGFSGDGALMREQDLQPFSRDRRGARPLEEIHQFHAALRPKSLPKRLLRSLGILTSRASPLSRLAASK